MTFACGVEGCCCCCCVMLTHGTFKTTGVQTKSGEDAQMGYDDASRMHGSAADKEEQDTSFSTIVDALNSVAIGGTDEGDDSQVLQDVKVGRGGGGGGAQRYAMVRKDAHSSEPEQYVSKTNRSFPPGTLLRQQSTAKAL